MMICGVVDDRVESVGCSSDGSDTGDVVIRHAGDQYLLYKFVGEVRERRPLRCHPAQVL